MNVEGHTPNQKQCEQAQFVVPASVLLSQEEGMRDKVATGGKMVLPIGRSEPIKESFVDVGSFPLLQSRLSPLLIGIP